MLNKIYKMSECGVAEKIDKAHWYNSAGKQVDNEEDTLRHWRNNCTFDNFLRTARVVLN